MESDDISAKIIECAIKVHKALGPGLLESTYEVCLLHELRKSGLNVQAQLDLPILYDGVLIQPGQRIDLLVEEAVVVELKSVSAILPIHEAQLLSYLKLSGKKLGLLINFNVTLLKHGIRRRMN